MLCFIHHNILFFDFQSLFFSPQTMNKNNQKLITKVTIGKKISGSV